MDRLACRRANHAHPRVRGYGENATTTPFDMTVLSDLDRLHLAGDVIERVPSLGSRAACAKQHPRDRLLDHQTHGERHLEDMPKVRAWH